MDPQSEVVENPTPAVAADDVPATDEGGLEGLDDLLSDDESSDGSFAELSSDADERPQEVSNEPPAPSPAPAQEPAPAPATAPEPTAPPAPEPAAQPSPPAAEVPLPPPAPVDPAAELARQQQHRQEFESKLTSLYSMDETTAQEFDTNPAAVLPKIAAKLHIEVLQATVQGVMQALPQVLEQYNGQQAAVKQAEDEFYGAWPELNKPELRQSVREMSRQWRALNPGASKADAIANVGALVMVRHQLSRSAPQQPQQPVTPQPPAMVPSYRPAAPGSSGGVVKPPQSAAPGSFDEFVDEVVRDDS
jgi:hypothetical protein